MSEFEELRQVVQELTGAVHVQAKQLEWLVERLEQSVGPIGLAPEFGIVAAETAALLVRLKTIVPPVWSV